MKLYIQHMIYIWIAMMPFCTLYLGTKVLKIQPKYIALLLLTNLIPGVLYWLMIRDVILALYQVLPFVSCFIWVWVDDILRKREISISYNAIFTYKEGKIYFTFPDFEIGSLTADTREDGIRLAEETLIDVLEDKNHLCIPDKTPRERIKVWEDTEIIEITVGMELMNDVLRKKS